MLHIRPRKGPDKRRFTSQLCCSIILASLTVGITAQLQAWSPRQVRRVRRGQLPGRGGEHRGSVGSPAWPTLGCLCPASGRALGGLRLLHSPGHSLIHLLQPQGIMASGFTIGKPDLRAPLGRQDCFCRMPQGQLLSPHPQRHCHRLCRVTPPRRCMLSGAVF